ncbi:hypothetical protein GOARA_045_00120 [Gordonia araii NBRC 100433]|uniref:DUF3093 domain-containing protein n=1 Tax=Gordonia araii NBRC 100433 TaxID=1073574 RepID=G7H1D3_9ACTN|nr:hypothetical protein [Gordonia araii]NNG97834.1 DUF3093 domain-containing protein [Gordonia araii NBRC 100433]GAB09658.1 hypothetical protein GOARA_045_00120 [Gordonia araii NBRC 100433]
MSEAVSGADGRPEDESFDEDAFDDESSSEAEQDEDAADDGLTPIPEDVGEVLYAEPGAAWWPMAIGPVLIGSILIMEAMGPGQVHWVVMGIFFVIITGFMYLWITAARRHVSVELTEKTLRCGERRLHLADIDTIYPSNEGTETKEWEKAPALGELPGVPRGRKGIGIKTTNGKLAQAWARDVDRLRTELTEAHLAVQLGL